MPTPNEILKSFTKEDWEDIEKQIAHYSQQRKKDLESFWHSDICLEMINDVISLNASFDNEQFSYSPETVKNQLGWQNIANDNIEKFMQVMASTTIGITEDNPISVDKECMFENNVLYKKGLKIFTMSGQGTYISICSDIEHIHHNQHSI